MTMTHTAFPKEKQGTSAHGIQESYKCKQYDFPLGYFIQFMPTSMNDY
jgi:hypothetical protein